MDQLASSVMEATWTLQDAKNRFSALVEAALQGTPQKVTRRGEWVGVMLSAAEYERLRQCELAAAPSLTEQLLALPQDGEPFERLPLVPRDFPCS